MQTSSNLIRTENMEALGGRIALQTGHKWTENLTGFIYVWIFSGLPFFSKSCTLPVCGHPNPIKVGSQRFFSPDVKCVATVDFIFPLICVRIRSQDGKAK